MSGGKPTKRRGGAVSQQRTPEGPRPRAAKGAPMTEEERRAHALSQRRAFFAAVGATLFAAGFIVLVLVLNQLPWR